MSTVLCPRHGLHTTVPCCSHVASAVSQNSAVENVKWRAGNPVPAWCVCADCHAATKQRRAGAVAGSGGEDRVGVCMHCFSEWWQTHAPGRE